MYGKNCTVQYVSITHMRFVLQGDKHMRLPSMEEDAALDAIRNMVNDADTSATAGMPLVPVDEYLNPITSRSCTVDDSAGGALTGGTLTGGENSRPRTLPESGTETTDGTRSPIIVFEGLGQDPRASSSRMQQVWLAFA